MSDHVKVWCLRHAESENVVAGVAGAVPAAALTALGRYEAAAAARALGGEPIARIYCSTAVRARQTAAAFAGGRGPGVVALAELAEVGIGRHEGTSDPAVRRRTAEVLRAWIIERDLGQRVADGESGLRVLARVSAAFRHIADTHAEETVVVVGHVASLTLTVASLCGLGSHVWGTPLPHAEPFVVEWDGRSWHCHGWPNLSDRG
ncbi:histidine phosphatase family protein [Nocardia sp. NPDC051052]|uniref:histidine phosphatase family protein n=1 Tax=Nocardia sp. NPDC051052 TaxID=3364322 RepID=UPI00379BF1C6